MPTAVERYFLKLDGLTTNVTAEFAIESFQWGFGTAGGGGGAGRPQFTEIQITRQLDQNSPMFFHAASRGQRFTTAAIYCRKAGGDTAITTVTYSLGDVQIASYTHTGNQHGGLPTEGLNLNFLKLDFAITTSLT